MRSEVQLSLLISDHGSPVFLFAPTDEVKAPLLGALLICFPGFRRGHRPILTCLLPPACVLPVVDRNAL